MFKVTMSDTTAKVVRTVVLPKAGPLDQLTLTDSYKVQLDLAGLDKKSPVYKEITTNFPKVYANQLNSNRKVSEEPAIKAWTDAGKLLKAGKASQAEIEKLAKETERKIVKQWNEFNVKRAKPWAESILKSQAEHAAKRPKSAA